MNSSSELPLTKQIEAILMVSPEPLSSEHGAEVLGVTITEFESAIEALQEFYLRSDRGFFLQRVAGGYRFASSPEMSDVIERFALSQSPPRLSSAALETLAIVAYRQPISRAQIASIRGVNSDYVVRLLVSMGYIESSGNDPGPGLAKYYVTTTAFLDKLGIYSLSELPSIDGFMPEREAVEALEASLFDSD